MNSLNSRQTWNCCLLCFILFLAVFFFVSSFFFLLLRRISCSHVLMFFIIIPPPPRSRRDWSAETNYLVSVSHQSSNLKIRFAFAYDFHYAIPTIFWNRTNRNKHNKLCSYWIDHILINAIIISCKKKYIKLLFPFYSHFWCIVYCPFWYP